MEQCEHKPVDIPQNILAESPAERRDCEPSPGRYGILRHIYSEYSDVPLIWIRLPINLAPGTVGHLMADWARVLDSPQLVSDERPAYEHYGYYSVWAHLAVGRLIFGCLPSSLMQTTTQKLHCIRVSSGPWDDPVDHLPRHLVNWLSSRPFHLVHHAQWDGPTTSALLRDTIPQC